MMTIRLLLVCVLCLFVVPVAADDPAQANRLLVEAVRLIQAAEAEKAATEKLALLETALAKLNEIVEDHPTTDLAVKLITGQEIGNLSLAGVENTIKTLRLQANQVTVEARRSSCLETLDFSDPICLTVYAQEVEQSIQDEAARTEAFALIARAQAIAGDGTGAEETLGKALAIAENLTSLAASARDNAGEALGLVLAASVHALSGDIQNALSGIVRKIPGALRKIQNPQVRHQLLVGTVLGLSFSGSLPEVILTMLRELDDASAGVQLFTLAAGEADSFRPCGGVAGNG